VTIHRVCLETTHFSFEAFGATSGEAMLAFRKGWDAHAKATGAAPFKSDYFARSLFPDMQYHEIELGACYRDREILTQSPKEKK
jgi:hypothetical protein